MPATRYTLKLATGEIVTGCIHGSGGLVGGGPHNADRVRKLIERASKGWSLSVYEPKPGHCAMYPAYDTDFSAWRHVDLRGAEFVAQETA